MHDDFVQLSGRMHQGMEDIAQDVLNALGHLLGRDRKVDKSLSPMGAVARQDGGTQRRPDQTFGDLRIAGVEGVQVGVGFPLFEHQLNLPPQAITIDDVIYREFSATQIGQKILIRLGLRVP